MSALWWQLPVAFAGCLLIWRLVQWADRIHLGRRLWTWRVPQIAALVLAVGLTGLGIAALRASTRDARERAAAAAATEARLRERAAAAAATEARLAERLAVQTEACQRIRGGVYWTSDIGDCPGGHALVKENACVHDFHAMPRDEWRARWRDFCSAAVERQTGLTRQQ